MSDIVKISELPVASAVNNNDIIPIVQNGINKQATADKMRRY